VIDPGVGKQTIILRVFLGALHGWRSLAFTSTFTTTSAATLTTSSSTLLTPLGPVLTVRSISAIYIDFVGIEAYCRRSCRSGHRKRSILLALQVAGVDVINCDLLGVGNAEGTRPARRRLSEIAQHDRTLVAAGIIQ
jgi:hypothetical protein